MHEATNHLIGVGEVLEGCEVPSGGSITARGIVGLNLLNGPGGRGEVERGGVGDMSTDKETPCLDKVWIAMNSD